MIEYYLTIKKNEMLPFVPAVMDLGGHSAKYYMISLNMRNLKSAAN